MKKRIVIVALLVCILVLSIASTTIAYFTDTETATNTFTAGKVEITLTETGLDGNDIVINESPVTTAYGELYPGKVVAKNPTITVASDSKTAYIGAVITIKNTEGDGDISTMLTDVDNDPNDKIVAINEFLDGLINTGATVTYKQITKGWEVYVVIEATQAANAEIVLFNNVVVPDSWDNAEMAHCNHLSIVVDAYATQVDGMENGALAALQAAFDVFD